MFGRTKEIEVSGGGGPRVSVSTIPMEFYAGANPVIKFRSVERVIGGKPLAVSKLETKAAAKSSAPQKSTVGLFGNKKFLISGTVGLFVIFLVGAGVYYWRLSGGGSAVKPPPSKPPIIKITPQVTPPIATVPTSTPVVTSTVPVEAATSTVPPSLTGGLIEFPSVLLGISADLDRDGLTDVEEELFTSDAGKPDTDGDSYDDGREIFHLYSPTDYAPARLITGSIVKEYLNPIFQYKIYYPSSWAVGNVDPEYRDMLFSTLSGENIEVRVFDRASQQTFEDWFAVNFPNELGSALLDFKTVFGAAGKMRNDKLVYYFNDAEHFYVVVYHVTDSNVINYREVIEMAARSFRASGDLNAVLPNLQEVFPPTGAGSEASTITNTAGL